MNHYVVQQFTGGLYGWENVYVAEDLPDAEARLEEYRENQPEFPARITHKYVRTEAPEHDCQRYKPDGDFCETCDQWEVAHGR